MASTEKTTGTCNNLVQSKNKEVVAPEPEVVASNLTEKSSPEKRIQGNEENLRLLDINTSREPKRKSSTSPPAPPLNAEKDSSVEFAKPKKVAPKTFARKSKPKAPKGISALPGTLKPSFKVASRSSTRDLDDGDWKQIVEFSSQAANAFQKDDGYNELSHLMKAATGVKDIDLNVVKQIQNKLSIDRLESDSRLNTGLTFIVNSSKASIDLPTEENQISVCNSDADIPVFLDSNSDSITGDVLKNKEPEPQLTVQPKKKGRPQRPKSRVTMPFSPANSSLLSQSPQPSLQLVQTPPQQHSNPQDQMMDGFLQNPQLKNQFKYHLACLMQNFVLPPNFQQYIQEGADPVVLMMMARAQDPQYANIDFNAMLTLYGKLICDVKSIFYTLDEF